MFQVRGLAALFACFKSPALLVAALLAAGDAAAQSTSVRVLDFNIRRGIGGTDSTTSEQLEIAKIVNYLQPDVWTINELGGNSSAFNPTTAHDLLVSFIRNDLTIFGANPQEGTNFFLYIGTIDDNYITNAIVSRYPLLATHTYSDGGGGFGSVRGLEMALVDVPGPNDVGVFTAHLKAQSTTTDAEKRQAEANADKTNVTAWMSAHPGDAVIFSGDWNETEDAGETDNWSTGQIGDSLPNGGGTYHPITTMRSSGLLDARPLSIAGDKDTIDSASPNARFDYLLYSSGALSLTSGMVFDTKQYTSAQLAALNLANGTNFLASDSANASDHLPVFGVFATAPEPGTASLFVCAAVWIFGAGRRTRHGQCRDS
jgi:endonuclease/exonuclease/phosphatase family metal-dependent hydrolase